MCLDMASGVKVGVGANAYRYNGKELLEEHGYYFYGFRIYDPAIGRFPSADPIADEFPWVSVYNYAENEPIANIDLHGLQKVSVHSEVLDGKRLGGGIQGRIASWFRPRHAFLEVQTSSQHLSLELGGPQNGSAQGTPYRNPYNSNSRRSGQMNHNLTRPEGYPEGGGDFSFEEKIVDVYEVLSNNLPDYNAFGPNSNGFVNSIILLSGGEVDMVAGHGVLPGAGELQEYFSAYFGERPDELSGFKTRIGAIINEITLEGMQLKRVDTADHSHFSGAMDLQRRLEFYESILSQLNEIE